MMVGADLRPEATRLNGLVRAAHGNETQTATWSGAPMKVLTWWGAVLDVEPGDRIVYFPTPRGAAVEAVVPEEEA